MRQTISIIQISILWLCLFSNSLKGNPHGLPSSRTDYIDIGEVSRAQETFFKTVCVMSDVESVANLAKKAFSVHGSLNIVDKSRAQFVVQFFSKDNRIKMIVEYQKKCVFEGIFQANTFEESVLKACDAFVEEILHMKGFFASKVAFVGERTGSRELYISDLFFQNVKQITDDRSKVVSPHWSPDGQKILFTSYYKTGFPDIFRYDLVKKQRELFAGYRGTNTGAVYHPSGKIVAMSLSTQGDQEIFFCDVNGKNLKRMTHNKSIETTPTWSPNGKRLAMTSDTLGHPQIYEMPTQGGMIKRVPTNISKYCAEPNWNPFYENKILFTAAVNGGYQLALYDFQRRESRFLTQGSCDSIEGCWLRDGRHVLFTQWRKSERCLCILDTETGKVVPLHSKNLGNASQASVVYIP